MLFKIITSIRTGGQLQVINNKRLSSAGCVEHCKRAEALSSDLVIQCHLRSRVRRDTEPLHLKCASNLFSIRLFPQSTTMTRVILFIHVGSRRKRRQGGLEPTWRDAASMKDFCKVAPGLSNCYFSDLDRNNAASCHWILNITFCE